LTTTTIVLECLKRKKKKVAKWEGGRKGMKLGQTVMSCEVMWYVLMSHLPCRLNLCVKCRQPKKQAPSRSWKQAEPSRVGQDSLKP